MTFNKIEGVTPNIYGGTLYRGSQSLEERGFKVGDIVAVGRDWGEPKGTIIDMDSYRAKIRFDHGQGFNSECWVNSEFIAPLTKKTN